MRVKRGFVYAGIFLVAFGGVLAAADAGRVDAGTLGGIVRLWPVAFVAVGAALILRRTKLGLSGGMVAAAMPGLLLGSGIAFVPKYSGTCAADQAPALAPAGHGSFFGPPMVSIYTGCGRTDIHTQPGTTWQLLAGNTGAAQVVLDSDGRSLGITDNLSGSEILSGGRSAWDVTLPRMPFDQLDLNLNAQAVNADLAGTQIADLGVVANASSGRIDASAAVIGQLTAQLNLSSLSIKLPPGHDVFATVRVNGGHLALCVPSDVAMRVQSRGTAERVTVSGGLIDRTWETDNYSSATYRAEIDIQARFGEVDINPLGGCS